MWNIELVVKMQQGIPADGTNIVALKAMRENIIRMRYTLILLLVIVSLSTLPSQGKQADGASTAASRQVETLETWDYCVNSDDHSPQVTKWLEPGTAQHLNLPLAWEHFAGTRGCTGAVWYAHDVLFPPQLKAAEGVLTIESPVGLLDVFFDDQHLATIHGIGLTQRLPLPGPAGSHRLRLRLAYSGLSAAMQQSSSCGLGPISLLWLPVTRIISLSPVMDCAHHLVTVHYRLAADTSGPAQLRFDLLPAEGEKAITHVVVGMTLTPASQEGEKTFSVAHLKAWTPRLSQSDTHWVPQIYRLRASLTVRGHAVDVRETTCGCCDVALNGLDLLVGGKHTILKGMRLPGGVLPLHDSSLRQMAETELSLISRAGFNTVMADGAALSEDMLTTADQCGLMIVGEIPLAPDAAGATTPAIADTVRACGHHPCLVAWSWESAGTPEQQSRESAALRAVDPARPALLRQGTHSLLVPPYDTFGIPVTDLDLPESAHWPDLLQQAEEDSNHHLMVISGVGVDIPAGDPNDLSSPVLGVLAELRAMVEQIRSERQSPLFGYFIRLRAAGVVTGLSDVDGAPTVAFSTALACNASCLLSLQVKSPTGFAPEIAATLINDEKLSGEYQLYQVLTSPDGHTAILNNDMNLSGDRIQGNLENLFTLPIDQDGEYRLQLVLTQNNALVAATQVVSIPYKKPVVATNDSN